MSREQMGSERLADYFINYLFDVYHGTRHVHRVASWVGLIVLAVNFGRRACGHCLRCNSGARRRDTALALIPCS